jgi:hypothetical protein
MSDGITHHMRELLEQYQAEQPAQPDSSQDIYDTVSSSVDERNTLFQWNEYCLRRVTEMAVSFRNRHGRLPHSIQELLADPVCKKMQAEAEEALMRVMR